MTILLGILVLVLLVRYALPPEHRYIVRAAAAPAFLFGFIGFAAGFFGPMYLAPGANQGPLLGIFITGPLGFMAGLAWGVIQGIRKGAPADP